jgi:leader peptidase (prepilin peptidase)/N-methyltransferase
MDWWQVLRDAEPLYGVFLVCLGGIAGSFASAAIFRIPQDHLSLWKPSRSFCPSCKHTLRWQDNLPLVGWFLLRGKCRYCQVSYGSGYLVHEWGLAILFLAVGGSSWASAGPLAMLIVLVVLVALWVAAAIDFRHFILPDGITLGGIPFGFLAAYLVPAFHLGPELQNMPWGLGFFGLNLETSAQGLALASAALGSGISFILLFGIRALFSYLLGQEALGLGDVKYLTAVGALLGLEGSIWTLLVGVMAGAVFGLFNIFRMSCLLYLRHRRRGRQPGWRHTLHRGWWFGRQIPFGPPLVLGTGLVLFFPDELRLFFLKTWPQYLQDSLL